MATLNVGRVRLLNKGEYSVSASYDFFDWVTYEGSSYVVTASSGAPAGTLPTDTSYWSLLADKGDKGDTGLAASVSVGSVSTGAPDSPASVTNSGTENDAVFNFVIPKGDTGATGPMGGVYSRGLGEMVFSLLPITDAGLHLLDGSLLSVGGIYNSFITHVASLQTAYPGLFTTETAWQASVSAHGVCGKFVYTEGTSLRLPKITGFVEGTLDSGALGDLVEAGLPNITGESNIGGNAPKTVSSSGALKQVRYQLNAVVNATSSDISDLAQTTLDASLSNSIYGKSTTVQPQAVKGYFYMVVATATKTDIQINIDNITTDLNSKAGTDLTNLSPAGKTKVANLAMPSNNIVDLTYNGHGSAYTAPADGYVTVIGFGASTPLGINVTRSSDNVIVVKNTCVGFVDSGSAMGCSVPVSKGQRFTVFYYGGTITKFTFTYAQGSQP